MPGFWIVGAKFFLLLTCTAWLFSSTTKAVEIAEHRNLTFAENMYKQQHYMEAYDVLGNSGFPSEWEDTVGLAYNHVVVIRAVPYARPPVGPLRFEKPQPHPGWEGMLNATETGHKCPQYSMAFQEDPSSANENCLTLDIYIPPMFDEAAGVDVNRPVVVYFHGGNFLEGSKDEFYGLTLSLEGLVVVVTVNYRLGLLGFMASGDGVVPGNLGLYDQQMAVQWVKANIGSYGGDADYITLIGFADGGISALAQMLSPLNNGSLFQRVIILSSSLSFQPPTARNSSALKQMESQLFDKVLVASECNGSSNAVGCLRDLPASHFVITANDLFPDHYSPTLSLSFGSEFIPWESDDIMGFTDDLFSYDVMIGFTEHDGAEIACYVSEEQNLTDVIEDLVGWADSMGELSDSAMKILRHYYTDFSDPDISSRRAREFTHLFDDWFFNVPASQFAEALVEANLTSTYVFRLIGPIADHPFRATYGGWESTQDDMEAFLFGIPIIFDYPEHEKNASENLIKLISNFAYTGDPNKGNFNFTETWSKYDVDSMNVFQISEQLTTSYRSNARALDLWINLLSDLGENEMCDASATQPTPPVSYCSDKANALKDWKERMEEWKVDNQEWKEMFDKYSVVIGSSEEEGSSSAIFAPANFTLTDVIKEILQYASIRPTPVAVKVLQHVYTNYEETNPVGKRLMELPHLFDDWLYFVPNTQLAQTLTRNNVTTYMYKLRGPIDEHSFRNPLYSVASKPAHVDTAIFALGVPIVFPVSARNKGISESLIGMISNFGYSGYMYKLRGPIDEHSFRNPLYSVASKPAHVDTAIFALGVPIVFPVSARNKGISESLIGMISNFGYSGFVAVSFKLFLSDFN